LTIKKLVEGNKFDYCNSEITDANFPIIDDVDIRTVTSEDIGRDFTWDEAIEFLDKKGLKPVSAATGLRYVRENHEAQLENPLLALAQSMKKSLGFVPLCVPFSNTRTSRVSSVGYFCILVLLDIDRERFASLRDVRSQFRRRCRVLAEPKLKKPTKKENDKKYR